MQSRLAALRAGAAADVVTVAIPGAEEAAEIDEVRPLKANEKFMAEFFGQVETIKGHIAFLRETSKKITDLKEEAVNAISSSKEKELSEKLAGLLTVANKKCDDAKRRLKQIEAETKASEGKKGSKPSETRIRRNMHTTLQQKFVQVVRVYQQAQQDYKTKIQDKVARQVKVVKPDATYEEIDTALRCGDTGAIYRAAILQGGNDPIAEAFRNVTSKYQDIVKLEKSMVELNGLFQDMAILVTQQGDLLGQIESQVHKAAAYVDKGNEELVGAIKARKRMRKCYCYLIIICLIIGVVMVTQLT